jgi:hypothetical protein
MRTQEKPMAKYQDIIWLAGLILLRRDFVKEADEKGLEAILKECPYGDLTGDQRATFEAAFRHPRLREEVERWWAAYDAARAAGEIPEVREYWEP